MTKVWRSEALASPAKTSTQTKVLVILGMHCSGTSAIARLCNLLGVELGGDILPPAPDNESGFWGHRDIHDIHEEVLDHLGSAWDDVMPLPENWADERGLAAFRQRIMRIMEVVRRDFGNTRLWGVYDPRLCRLLPLWRDLFTALNCAPYCLIVTRNPLEVARSLAVRNGFPAEKSLLLWLRHMLESEQNSRDLPRAFVTYDEVLRDWATTLGRAAALGLNCPVDPAEVAVEADRFLSNVVRHHVVPDAVVGADKTLSPWAKEVYSTLKAAAAGDADRALKRLSRINRELAEAGRLYDPVVVALQRDASRLRETGAERDRRIEVLSDELAAARQRTAGQDAEIERLGGELSAALSRIAEGDVQLQAIYLSTSWRVTRPLRAVKRGLLATTKLSYYGRVLVARTARPVYQRLPLSYQHEQRFKSFIYRKFGVLIKAMTTYRYWLRKRRPGRRPP